MRSRLLVVTAAFALAACGGGDDGGTTAPASGWIDVPGMVCADGTQTGIGISRGSADRVLVYLAGGGACWSDAECHANTPRAFDRALFEFATDVLVPGTILDRTVPGNPFATWTTVAIPYCTGDVHAGDRENAYGGTTWLHHGYLNLQAAVARMAAEVAQPAQVVVAGSSAGGFGALVAYDLVRAEWPADAVEGALVDDSAPTFATTTMQALTATWWEAWGLGSTVTPVCPNCATDLSAIWDELSASYRDDRFALVSTTRDLTMRSFFGNPNLDFSGPVFQAALKELTNKLAPLPNVRTFVVSGTENEEDHALLFPNRLNLAPPVTTYAASDGTTLLEWLTAMVDPESAWTSHGP
jgi:hypothetical protein